MKRIWKELVPAIPEKNMEILGDREMWYNDIYTVIVNRGIKTSIGSFTWLSIRRNDRGVARDWRHFQYIKNQLVGRECEGVEIFPAERRLVDGANQYHLWVLESTEFMFPFGFNERTVAEAEVVPNSKQRPFEDNMKPYDLKEQEERARNEYRIRSMKNKH